MNPRHEIFSLDHAHPNYERWQRAIDAATLRGELVVTILEKQFSLRDKRILDVGCGVGGTSHALRRTGAIVTSIDRNPARIGYGRQANAVMSAIAADATRLPFPEHYFDLIILQDVIEHVSERDALLRELARVLTPKGALYLTTPNRLSCINIIADPHWGLPLVSLLPRNAVRFVLHTFLRREKDRTDFAELLSFDKLQTLLDINIGGVSLKQRIVVEELFTNPSHVVWSNLHRYAISILNNLRLTTIVRRIVNDRDGFFNRYVAPGWYCICEKRAV